MDDIWESVAFLFHDRENSNSPCFHFFIGFFFCCVYFRKVCIANYIYWHIRTYSGLFYPAIRRYFRFNLETIPAQSRNEKSWRASEWLTWDSGSVNSNPDHALRFTHRWVAGHSAGEFVAELACTVEHLTIDQDTNCYSGGRNLTDLLIV